MCLVWEKGSERSVFGAVHNTFTVMQLSFLSPGVCSNGNKSRPWTKYRIFTICHQKISPSLMDKHCREEWGPCVMPLLCSPWSWSLLMQPLSLDLTVGHRPLSAVLASECHWEKVLIVRSAYSVQTNAAVNCVQFGLNKGFKEFIKILDLESIRNLLAEAILSWNRGLYNTLLVSSLRTNAIVLRTPGGCRMCFVRSGWRSITQDVAPAP